MAGRMHSGAAKPLYQMARDLRDKATHSETILWGYLKTKPLGFKFRRQHPYSIYILDFYCHSLKLVIEVDGSIHDLDEVKEKTNIGKSLYKEMG
ncbi:MAG: endonuclease domain-containing protein [Chitinophagaceae bacterium]